jgi:hypothetical protein|tara:strand:+ start:1279 stop:8973 length:7695 start_codon:yes stop_codon:yes gene_type:complete
MPQETNLNVAPYFDDFDSQSNYYKVLFKPGFPVQARELTGLQSILQNQVEEMGNHFFKEGTKVIPGDLTYVRDFYGVQIEPEFLGVPVGIYLDQIVGTTITGATSGVTAKVVTYITDQESERNTFTLYLNYENSSTTDEELDTFLSGEVLTTSKNITYASTFISSGEGFAATIPQNAPIIGSSFNIADGVYFLRGYFVNVSAQTLILDQYNNRPSYRIGLDIIEEIISSDIDESLSDNAQGFNNFTAPGADRLKISTNLAKKSLDNFEDASFVQLSEVKNGELRIVNKNTDYNFIGDEFARRTFDESGNYYVKSFRTAVRDSLNNNQGNRGIFEEGQSTNNGQTPSDDIGIYKISPGKAYVKGYEVEKIAPTLLDFFKPRTVKRVEQHAVSFDFGSTLRLNNVNGSATIGINTSLTLSLRNKRVGSNALVAAGKEVGIARVYDFALESGAYDLNNSNINQWDLSLFDVQVYTDISVNEPVTLNTSTHIKGESSGAEGFLKYNVSAGTALTAYNVNGNFHKGERLLFNGVIDDSRFVTSDTNYSLSDVKSVHGIVGTANTFSGDTIQSKVRSFGSANVAAESGSQSLVSIPADPGFSFVGIVTVGNIVRYSRNAFDIQSLGRVVSVGATNFAIEAVESVTGVCNGALPTSVETVQNLELITTKLAGGQRSGNTSGNNTLFTSLPKVNIESVDLINSDIIIRRQYTTSITDNSTSSINAGENEVFLPYDEERYILIRSNGDTEILSEDRFSLTNGSTTLQINGLGANDTGSRLITTIRKSKVKAKTKIKNISKDIIINKSRDAASGIGSTTLNDGLEYGEYPYGTRVQDDQISLNTPDVYKIYGIFESEDTTDPTAPYMTLGQLNGNTATTNDLIIGETLIGQTSGAKAIYLQKLDDTNIYFSYLNDTSFLNNEEIKFQTSSVSGVSSLVKLGSKNITSDFKFDNGQRSTIYDYSRIVRRAEVQAPSKKIRIYYASAGYQNSDDGDITTIGSYEAFDYGKDLGAIDGFRVSDIIDVRPRVADYSVSEGANSPFEFSGRSFADGQSGRLHSAPHVIASDESMTLDYAYFLGRVDRIFIDTEGNLGLTEGAAEDDPKMPPAISNTMSIATIYLPPFLYNVSDAEVKFIEHKRYQMTDIAKLEQRIKNLEYYTSLNQLESQTLNSFVEDANGLNRFKSGVFVDNFSSLEPQDTSIGIRNSIDRRNGILRPSHHTTALNLQLSTRVIDGVSNESNTSLDTEFANPIGVNVRKTGQTVTLDYTDVEWLNQPYATRVESVTPYLVQFWQGNVELTPEVDVWIDTTQAEINNVMMEGSFQGIAEALGAEVTTNADGQSVGVTPTIWNSWETTGVNLDLSLSDRSQSSSVSTSNSNTRTRVRDRGARIITENTTTTETTTTTTNDHNISATSSVSLNQQRTGTQFTVNEQINTETLGNFVVNTEIINFMRSRNITVKGSSLKPFTRVYSFFDGVAVTKFCTPKLIEIEMIHGTFLPGEDVLGDMNNGGVQMFNSDSSPRARFRVANSNHKFGPYTSPTDFYGSNPYSRDNQIPELYSSSSSTLNVDLFSLQSTDFPQYFGRVETNMILTGQTSGAQARVRRKRLVTDRVGTLLASFRVPESGNSSNPSFETGRSLFRLTSSSTNSSIQGTVTTSGESIFYSQGDLTTTQETTLSLRNARVGRQEFTDTRTLSDSAETEEISFTIVNTETDVDVDVDRQIRRRPRPRPRPPRPAPRPLPDPDPLAQTFLIDDDTGIFVTKVDIYFRTKSDNGVPVVFEIRETYLGTPSEKILPFSQVTLNPNQVQLSDDGSAVTTFTFQSPVYLEAGKEYAMVLKSHSTDYSVYISRLGEVDITTLGGGESDQVIVSEQPLLGSLFKSQNASVWTPSQYEDLKFKLYRAEFSTSGSVSFYNPGFTKAFRSGSSVDPNGISLEPRQLRVGLGTTVNHDSDVPHPLQVGNTVKQLSIGAQGTLVAFAGSATGDLSLTNVGSGFTPSLGGFTYTGVALTAITGKGINGTVDITINGGVAVAATINAGGSGYVVGDVLTPVSVGSLDLGSGIQLSVQELLGNNTLVLENVQGNFSTNSAYPLYYENNVGFTTELNGVGGDVIPLSPITVAHQGDYMKVFKRNHGLYSNTNRATIENVQSDVVTNNLAQDYPFDTTSFITLESDSEIFKTFENIGVAGTNPGYVRIGDEIISYTGVNGRTLTGITRGVDNTTLSTHSLGELIYKYELDGVSLRRINREHQLANVVESELDEPAIGLDYYYVKVLMNANGTNRAPANSEGFPPLYFNDKKVAGGPLVQSTHNIPFHMIIPRITNITPLGTNLISQVRTVSASSVSGNQENMVDQGFQEVNLFEPNYFDSLRMLASGRNEELLLNSDLFPGKRSFTLTCDLTTVDTRLSPAIDLDNASVVFTSNRINQPITNYAGDFKVSGTIDDPNRFVYVSKNIRLENPATSLQVLFDAYCSTKNDIRVFFALDQDKPVDETIFVPFPGFKNLDVNGSVLERGKSNGTPDQLIPKVDSFEPFPTVDMFREYKYSIDDLVSFSSFRIKIIGTSTDQAVAPMIRNLRGIALA